MFIRSTQKLLVTTFLHIVMTSCLLACEGTKSERLDIKNAYLKKDPEFAVRTMNGKSEIIRISATMLLLDIDIGIAKEFAKYSEVYSNCQVKIKLDDVILFDGIVSNVFSLPDYKFYYRKFGLPLDDDYISKNSLGEKIKTSPISILIEISENR